MNNPSSGTLFRESIYRSTGYVFGENKTELLRVETPFLSSENYCAGAAVNPSSDGLAASAEAAAP